MKYITEKTLMFSKDGSTFEITGSPVDYQYLQEEIRSGRLDAYIQEMI